MKATEKCSCGGTFEAEGCGAMAALREWREKHQHVSNWSPLPQPPVFQPLSPPWTPQPFRNPFRNPFTTFTGTLERPLAQCVN